MSRIIHGKTANYAVLQLVGREADYKVYIVENQSSGEQYLLKIANDVLGNGLLDREAFLLSQISEEIEHRNTVFKNHNPTESGLGFRRCFPKLVESFLVPEQGNRRVNIIAVYGSSSMSELVPIGQWRTRELVRLDPKSSAWIMGRLLKIFTLTHPMGVTVGKITGGNILVNPIEHHVVFFDWTQAQQSDGPISKLVAREEISLAARQIILALGGDPVTGALPQHEQLPDARYASLLQSFVDRKVDDAFTAGAQFYALLDELWEKEFHPFTTQPI